MSDMDNRDGIMLFFKEKGITSFRAINQIKKILNLKKIGHAGTLDLNAEGLLVVALGRATKLLKYFLKKDKSYTAVISFGTQTSTDDSLGEVINRYSGEIDFLKIQDALKKIRGKIEQVPPVFSNVHINGQRAYKLALKKEKINLKSKSVEIYNYKIESFKNSMLTITIDCSSGTYIRAIARDIGNITGYYAHLFSLRRIKIGDFNLNDAYSINDIKAGNFKIISAFCALTDFIPLEIEPKFKESVRNGISFSFSWLKDKDFVFNEDNYYKIHLNNQLLAVVKYSNGNFFYDFVY